MCILYVVQNQTYAVASALTVKGSVFMRRFIFFLGQCSHNSASADTKFKIELTVYNIADNSGCVSLQSNLLAEV